MASDSEESDPKLDRKEPETQEMFPFLDPRHYQVAERALKCGGLIEIKHEGKLIPQQAIFLNKATGRPYVPGTIVQRSDLPPYFTEFPDQCLDPKKPNILLLQDIKRVEPKSANKHIGFAQDFGSVTSLPHATRDIVTNNICSKERYEKLGPLVVTGFGGESYYEDHYTLVTGHAQTVMDERNNALQSVNLVKNIYAMAVFQCQDTWPEKGTNGSSVKHEMDVLFGKVRDKKPRNEDRLKSHEFMFVGYYCVSKGFNEKKLSEAGFLERFEDYPGLKMDDFRAGPLFFGFLEYELKPAFAFDLTLQNALQEPEYQVIVSYDCDKKFECLSFPTSYVLQVKNEDFSLPKLSLMFVPKDKIMMKCLTKLSDEEFKAKLRSIQPDKDCKPAATTK